jgi:hypothetical protein
LSQQGQPVLVYLLKIPSPTEINLMENGNLPGGKLKATLQEAD